MILTRLCNLIDQKIDPKMFTCTDLRSPNDTETDILVHLHKVSLLVNKKNILLFYIMFKCIFCYKKLFIKKNNLINTRGYYGR